MPNATYIGQIIAEVNAVTERCGPVWLYGENIDKGSRIAGLARGLTVNPRGRIQNVGNCELTHCGIGFGIMLDGGNAVLFAKQLDFMLLGLDQFVNTFNFIRAYRPRSSCGSFTVFVIVCDQGYQGPQSSFNGAGDFASIANIPVYCLNGAADASHVVGRFFVSPGFRIVTVSQRLFGAAALEIPVERCVDDGSIFRYRSGEQATVVSLNFSLRDAIDMDDELRRSGMTTDLFHVNFVPGLDLCPLVESCTRTGKLVLIDDSKTVTKFSDVLVNELSARRIKVDTLSHVRRGCSDNLYGANEDRFRPDCDTVQAFLSRPAIG
jgi:pyruvate/2-oxoglutarate/acetoin dehydrogenase E1 component